MKNQKIEKILCFISFSGVISLFPAIIFIIIENQKYQHKAFGGFGTLGACIIALILSGVIHIIALISSGILLRNKIAEKKPTEKWLTVITVYNCLYIYMAMKLI